MAYRTLEMTLISARDLKNVNTFSKMETYAVATLDGDARARQRTATDRDGGTNPSWNATMRFQISARDEPSRHVLHILLRADRVLGDRDIGEVHIPLKDLFSTTGDAAKNPQFLSYQVRNTSSGKPRGVLNLSYKLSDAASAPVSAAPPQPTKMHDYASAAAYPPPPSAYPPPASKISDPAAAYAPTAYPATAYPATAYPPPEKASKADYQATPYPAGSSAPYPPPAKDSKADQPVTAYPAAGPAYPPPPSSYGYGYGAPQQPAYGYGAPPPPQQPYGYGPPPPQYGYPPAGGYGYGAVPPQQPPRKNNNLGMGLGAGLLGGALGGLLIGDMIGDASGYDAGYDDGGGGFDF